MIRRLALLMMLAAAPLAAQAPVPTPLPALPAYQLGPLDVIEIVVANFPDLTTRTRIDADGGVTLPLVGKLVIGGLTGDAAARAVEAAYKAGGYVNAPTVRVEVVDYQSRKVSVLGEVTTQGLIVLDRGYSLAEILARAGGLTDAAASEATIVRQRPGAEPQRLTVDLSRLAEGVGGANAQVAPGDLIVVPRAPTFSVIGAVNKAGVYRLTTGMTVDQALATAGDVARIGSRRGLKVRRTSSDGVVTTMKVSAATQLLAGDVVIVRERLF